MKETLHVYGHFKAVISKLTSGLWVPIDIIDQKNQIVDNLLTHIMTKIGNTTTTNITQLTFGTGTVEPNRTNSISDMVNVYTNTLIGTPTHPEYNKIKYVFELGANENNGYNISEYALTLDDNTIVCRITRGIVEKKSNIRIDGTWEITIEI
jgi:hypothetical protein